jgi:hypothetical protein
MDTDTDIFALASDIEVELGFSAPATREAVGGASIISAGAGGGKWCVG